MTRPTIFVRLWVLAVAVAVGLASVTDTVEAGPACTAYTSTRSCIANGCGWCLQSNQCLDKANSASCSCSGACANCFRTFNVADGGSCPGYTSCQQCTSDPACGWNVYSMSCVYGDRLGACFSSQNSQCSGSANLNQTFYWQYGDSVQCPVQYSSCGQYLDCQACTSDGACGWNTYLNLCTEGNSYGACWSSHDSSCSGTAAAQKQSYWQYGSNARCPAKHSSCQQYHDCQLCTSDPACGWNVYLKTCVDGNSVGACESSQDSSCSGSAAADRSFYWQYGTSAVCPQDHSNCYRFADCATCTSDKACGWNTYLQLCTPGNQIGSCFSSEDSQCSGAASKEQKSYWQHGSSAICPANSGRCADHFDCASCVSDKACGWNGAQCVEGNQYGTCQSSQAGKTWSYGSCASGAA
eukprot:ANDGO_07330.mRNA.1 hypothetical protein AMSG_03742